MSTKGRSDYYAPGDYNACCDRCAAKFKASKLKKDWRGFMLCEWCWEPRHPQDFVRGLADPTPVPWVRGLPPQDAPAVCTMVGRTAVVGDAVVDCAIVEYTASVY